MKDPSKQPGFYEGSILESSASLARCQLDRTLETEEITQEK